MVTQCRVNLQTLVLFWVFVHLSRQVCVDVASDAEAVLGKSHKLTCISCLKREEVKTQTTVHWYYRKFSEDNSTYEKQKIYTYKDRVSTEGEGRFKGRLTWNGSEDLQDVSIIILNVTENDAGVYDCHIHRQFLYEFFTPSTFIEKNITLTVKEKASKDATAIYSEIMMYVLLVFLTFWLLVEMVYCYRKISKSDEQPQDAVTNYLAIPSEQKDNPAAAVAE